MMALLTGIVCVVVGVIAWRYGHYCGYLRGAIDGAAQARRNIEIENVAEDDGRIRLTCYPSGEPCFISSELVKALVPIEHDATALMLSNGAVVPVCETIENVEAALR